MDSPLSAILSAAVLRLLRPLVRILLRNGIAYSLFAELAKKTYVEVAFAEFTEPGRKQTVSRVSALTGLTRKETKRLHELQNPSDSESAQRYNRATRVIGGWLNDARFLDAEGEPLPLSLEDGEVSFASLVKHYSGDIPPRAMLAVLESAGTVVQEAEQVRLRRRAYIPGNDPVEKLPILGTDVAELITTIDHNLTSPADGLRFQRKVSNAHIHPDAVEAFRDLSAEKAQLLLEELDEWMSRHEAGTDESTDGSPGRYVSMGIYYYVRKDHEEDPS